MSRWELSRRDPKEDTLPGDVPIWEVTLIDFPRVPSEGPLGKEGGRVGWCPGRVTEVV